MGEMEPLANVLLALAIVLAAGRLAGSAAERLHQPAVLGELLVGVALGNLPGPAGGWLTAMAGDATMGLFASLGAVVLLFEIGLESTLGEMLRVGHRALLVAVLGVAAPWLLGWWVGALALPDRSVYVHAFLGATLTATSVGITARVLKDLGHARSPEARVILGAAVIDDVLGLVILAVVGSIVAAVNAGTAPSVAGAGVVLGKALVFLLAACTLGVHASPRVFAAAARLHGQGALLTTALACCFALAWLAARIGLAPIVGAYAAGLVLEEAHYGDFTLRGEHRLDELVRPVATFLVPTFFVLLGMRVDLGAAAHPHALGLALLLTAAAVLGKQACALGGLGGGLDAVSIGLGMVPRGEVGLIFANIGLGLTIRGEHVIDASLYSAVVAAVMLTTLVTPPLLRWRLTQVAAPALPRAAGS